MRSLVAASLVAVAAVSAAAEDPKPVAPKREPVEIKLAAKPGTAIRFRQSETANTVVNGQPYRGREMVQEYTVTVKASRPEGGLDVQLRWDLVRGKFPGARGAADVEFDSTKPLAEDTEPRTKLLVAIAVAVTKKPVDVSFDARGRVVSVSGLRELWMGAIKGTLFEPHFTAEKDFSDAKCVEEVSALFRAAPAGPHSVGEAWEDEVTQSVNGAEMTFGGKFAVSVADAEKAIVAAKLAWKPNPEATAGGAKAGGSGTLAATYVRKDGFLDRLTIDLKAARDTGAMKADVRFTRTIQRL